MIEKDCKTILTPTNDNLVSSYTHTLNPYSGCVFACSYCYVRTMPVQTYKEAPWGEWLEVKKNAAEVLPKDMIKARKKGQVNIFMSSATDPYQPIEFKTKLTRSLLELMVQDPPDFLLVQTRSPLVTRDIDLLQAMGDRVRVSMTLETDLETVRKAFAPSSPPLAARYKALQTLKKAGIATQVAISPVLPFSKKYPAWIAALQTDRVVLDDWFSGDGARGSRSKQLGTPLIYEKLGMEKWYSPQTIYIVEKMLKPLLPDGVLKLSVAGGFKP
jgi:DNA repair photolyase